MAYVDYAWYVYYGNGTNTGYFAVTQWAANTAKTVGQLIRPLTAPSAGNERVYLCVVAGTTHATTEPTFSSQTARGSKFTDGSVTWVEVTGQAGVNGEYQSYLANWTAVKNMSTSVGQIIKNNAGTYLFICTTAGTTGNGSEPTWNTTTGATTADNAATWTCIGATGSFSTWAAPIARASTAMISSKIQAAPNQYVFLHNSHSESTNSTTISCSKVRLNNVMWLSVDGTAAFPLGAANLLAGATIATGSSTDINLYGNVICYGITFDVNSGGAFTNNTANYQTQKYISCTFKHTGSGSGYINFNAGLTELINCTVNFSATGQRIQVAANAILKWFGGSITGTIPTYIFLLSAAGSSTLVDGVDLSAAGTGKTLFYKNNWEHGCSVVLRNCKIDTAVTIMDATQSTEQGWAYQLINCDSGATNYKETLVGYVGTLTQETTIVRTGGATDGTTAKAWKVVTTANTNWWAGFECPPLVIWNETTGSAINIDVYGIWGGGAVPTTDDIWIEAVYPSSSSYPATTVATQQRTVMATASNQTADSSTWGGSTTPFKMRLTFTPQAKGPIYVTVKCGKPSTTFYIDSTVVQS